MDGSHFGRCVGGGILTVAEIVAQHRHAVVRDLNALGYHGDTPIELGDLVSIVIAAPPGSAVRYWAEGGWSQTDQLLANLGEQQAGLTQLPQRYGRPGVREPVKPGPIQMSREEFDRCRARDLARGDQLAATEQRSAMKKDLKGVNNIV